MEILLLFCVIILVPISVFLAYRCIVFDFAEYIAKKESLRFRAPKSPISTKACSEVYFGFTGSPYGCLIHFYSNEIALQQLGDSNELVLDHNSFYLKRKGLNGALKIFGVTSGLQLGFLDQALEKEVAAWFESNIPP